MVGSGHRFHRFCLVAAFLVTLIWGLIYIGYGNPGIVDEPGQMEAMRHLAEHRPGFPPALPNLPGYHFLVIILSGGQPTLLSARLVTLGCALLGLVTFAGAWRQLHGGHPGGPTLLVSLLPVLQPFTAMAYTDAPALALLFAACWAQFSGRRALAAGVLALACLVRQTSLIWAGYLLVLEAMDCRWPRGAGFAARVPWRDAAIVWVERSRWLLLLVMTAGSIILYAGRVTLGVEHGNQLDPNPATIHFAAILLLLLGLPHWIAQAGGMGRAWLELRREHPGRTLGLTALALVMAAILAATYANPHVWNRELFWPDRPSAYVLLRNWPLVWIDRIPVLRLMSGLIVVGLTVGLIHTFARQRCTRELLLLLPFGALLLLANGLVEPRYLIQPCALGLLFLEPGATALRRQLGWFALLCVVQSIFVPQGLALW